MGFFSKIFRTIEEQKEVEVKKINIQKDMNGLMNNQFTGDIPQEVCDLIESNNLDINNILDDNANLINTCN